MQAIIENFNALFLKLLGSLKLKNHLIAHYVTVMLLFGPLFLLATYRFEAKPKEGKQAARQSCSNVNLAKTVAKRMQLTQSYGLFSYKDKNNVEVGNGTLMEKNSQLYFEKIEVQLQNLPKISILLSGQKLINKCLFKPGFVIAITSFNICTMPSFDEIVNCFIDRGMLFFIVFDYKTLDFERHICAYETESTGNYSVISYNILEHYRRYHENKIRGKKYIVYF